MMNFIIGGAFHLLAYTLLAVRSTKVPYSCSPYGESLLQLYAKEKPYIGSHPRQL